VLPHLAGCVGQDLVVILQTHAEPTFRQQIDDLTIELDKLFFRHRAPHLAVA
jgi:hypothetical protein